MNNIVAKLNSRGVKIEDIAVITHDLQKSYNNATYEECEQMVIEILAKRETIYTILTAIALDESAEKGLFDEEVNQLITTDNSLYGLDEILALSIVNLSGSIALTNFGYLDKSKPGIIGKLDREGKQKIKCHTFLDDIICALAASAASRIAHTKGIQ